ncbi:type II toxin-antitoxin system RelB family antitoxin [Klebsiella pneumoniae]|uniref:type II toxin-antitoxin system RelB family antitoxin n=1 Tax=Klebsiella pneumoniae TaxID=573 RepID=UPI003B2801D2
MVFGRFICLLSGYLMRLSPVWTRWRSKTGRTKTFYAREAILAHLEDPEDYYLSAETAARVRRGDEAVHSSEDVREVTWSDD